MLIVLEGLDGAGKSTQIELLCTYFEERGKRVKFLHFPRYDSPVYGDLIARFLRGELGGINEVHPFLIALLFAGDRGDAAKLINEWLESGFVVILDRYLYSNIAFQCAKVDDKERASELRDWIFNAEYGHFSIPRPDINLFLDVPISFVDSKLKGGRSGDDREYLKGGRDIHEESIHFQERVREVYLSECAKGDDLKRVDCSSEEGGMLSPEKIFSRIREKIEL
jgi:dTMP kinase